MIKILFFASARDRTGISETSYNFDHQESQFEELTARELLIKIGLEQEICEIPNIKCAINQSLSSLDSIVKNGDEVAFFPPVTGG